MTSAEGETMCGRFLFVAHPADVAELFEVPEELSLFPEPRYARLRSC
jgi:hypothetical protein